MGVGRGGALAERGGGARDEPVLALDAGGPSLAGPWSAAAALFAAGAPLDVDVLFAGRFHRPFDLDTPLRFLAHPCESAPLPARADAELSAQAADPPALAPTESADPAAFAEGAA